MDTGGDQANDDETYELMAPIVFRYVGNEAFCLVETIHCAKYN